MSVGFVWPGLHGFASEFSWILAIDEAERASETIDRSSVIWKCAGSRAQIGLGMESFSPYRSFLLSNWGETTPEKRFWFQKDTRTKKAQLLDNRSPLENYLRRLTNWNLAPLLSLSTTLSVCLNLDPSSSTGDLNLLESILVSISITRIVLHTLKASENFLFSD